MKYFKSKESYEVYGKKVFIVENDIDRESKTFNDLRPFVKIDGIKYKTLSIESYAIPYCRKGEIIGIMVENIQLWD